MKESKLQLSFKALFNVFKREWKRLLSGKIYLFCMVIAPLCCFFFFLSLMKEGLPTNLPIALVDQDHSASSRNLSRQLDAFTGTNIAIQSATFGEARQKMQSGDIYGILYIPEGFQREAASGKQPVLSFYTSNTYLIAGSLLFKDLKTITTLASASVSLQTGLAKGINETQLMAKIQPITVDTHPIGNPWLNYSIYLNNLILPGILQLMILLITVFSIGIEIKRKTAREWLQTGNHSIAISLIGKLLPHFIIFFIIGTILLISLYGLMHFPLHSGMFPMLIALILLILAAQALGVLMIGILPTLRLGLSFACLFGMISFSISGFSFPATAMYSYMRSLGNLFPLRHYYLIYVDQALNGRNLIYSWPSYVWLLAFLLLPLIILKNLKNALLYFNYIP